MKRLCPCNPSGVFWTYHTESYLREMQIEDMDSNNYELLLEHNNLSKYIGKLFGHDLITISEYDNLQNKNITILDSKIDFRKLNTENPSL